MSDPDITKPPEPGAGDTAYTVVKAGISAIPGLGGPAAEVFAAIIEPPLTKRRVEWVQSIAEGLQELEKKVKDFSLDQLSQNESFVTTLLQASQTAIRNHQKEKLEALRNAVLNSALYSSPDEDMRLMFIGFIDTVTAWHIRLLKYFSVSRGPYIGSESDMMHFELDFLESDFPQLKGQRSFYGWIIRDLSSKELLSTMVVDMANADDIVELRLTELGSQFLKFIISPM